MDIRYKVLPLSVLVKDAPKFIKQGKPIGFGISELEPVFYREGLYHATLRNGPDKSVECWIEVSDGDEWYVLDVPEDYFMDELYTASLFENKMSMNEYTQMKNLSNRSSKMKKMLKPILEYQEMIQRIFKNEHHHLQIRAKIKKEFGVNFVNPLPLP